MNLFPLGVAWGVLATVILVLAFYRRAVANKEDDFLHVDTAVAAQQQAVAKKLAAIDHWGKILTVIAAAFGLVIVALLLYNGWVGGSSASY